MLETSVSLLERVARLGLSDDWDKLLTIYRPFIDVQIRKFPQLASYADDIAQETALVLTRELPGFRWQRTGSFRAWLKQITVHQLLNANRKIARQRNALPTELDVDNQLADLADPNSEASRRWNEEHDRVVLSRVMQIVSTEVNPLQWRAFQAHVLDDEPAASVAQRLGVTENVVKIAKSRILQRIREEAAGLLD